MLDVSTALEALRRRNLDREGIPMVLALEGAAPAPADDPRRDAGHRLACALAYTHAALNAITRGDANADDAPGEREPEPDRDRAVSAEEATLAEAIAVVAQEELGGPPSFRSRLGPRDPQPLAAALASTANPMLRRTLGAFAEGRFVTVVNYHTTPASTAPQIDAELAAWGKRHARIGATELTRLIDTGVWSGEGPPLIPVFYEGFRSNYEWAAPACARAGLTGWFFVITGFLDTAPAAQIGFADAHHIGLSAEDRERDRVAMTWQEAAELAANHVVTSHTAHHRAAHTVRTPEQIATELEEPSRAIARVTGAPAVAHAWLYGSGLHGDPAAAALLERHGYRWLFGNVAIERATALGSNHA